MERVSAYCKHADKNEAEIAEGVKAGQLLFLSGIPGTKDIQGDASFEM
jgi:hypothetical protein